MRNNTVKTDFSVAILLYFLKYQTEILFLLTSPSTRIRLSPNPQHKPCKKCLWINIILPLIVSSSSTVARCFAMLFAGDNGNDDDDKNGRHQLHSFSLLSVETTTMKPAARWSLARFHYVPWSVSEACAFWRCFHIKIKLNMVSVGNYRKDCMVESLLLLEREKKRAI